MSLLQYLLTHPTAWFMSCQTLLVSYDGTTCVRRAMLTFLVARMNARASGSFLLLITAVILSNFSISAAQLAEFIRNRWGEPSSFVKGLPDHGHGKHKSGNSAIKPRLRASPWHVANTMMTETTLESGDATEFNSLPDIG
jgi:hypothetical protein